MAVVSVACEHGKEHGIIRENPVKGVKRVRRARGMPIANRSWTEHECRTGTGRSPLPAPCPHRARHVYRIAQGRRSRPDQELHSGTAGYGDVPARRASTYQFPFIQTWLKSWQMLLAMTRSPSRPRRMARPGRLPGLTQRSSRRLPS